MTRAALLTAGLLAIASCSSGSDAEPPPPLDTEAPTTTIEAPTTTEVEAEADPEETTTSATPTTTAAETTTTETPVTEPAETTDPDVSAEIDNVVAEAFADYEETWLLGRSAFEDPGNPSIREELSLRYADGSGMSVFDALDGFVESNEVSLPPEPEDAQGVVLVRSVAASEDFVAVFQTCETFTSDIVNSETGEPIYQGVDSTLREVQMVVEDGTWLVVETVSVDSFTGPVCE